MPDAESLIFSVFLIIFLFTGAIKLTIEQLTTIVVLLKKLQATIKSRYSLESGKLETRSVGEPESPPGIPAASTPLGDNQSEHVDDTTAFMGSGKDSIQ